MRYASARYSEAMQEESWKRYIADAIQTCSENTAVLVKGQYLKARYAETIKKRSNEDNRSGEEIVAAVVRKAGLVVKNNGSI